jgi:ABC-type uncharacterized transport system permease subunit
VKLLQRILRWLTEKLAHPRAVLVIIALGLALNGTALCLGLTADDHFHAVALRADLTSPGMERAPWDLFAFAKDPSSNRALMEEGVFPWWTDPALVIAFLRPLSSLTLWLDYALWPHSPLLMHVHSLAWFALLLAVVWRVYRSLLPSRASAALALLLYALDDARSYPVAWIANRNALVALAPGFLAVYAHHRWRDEDKTGWGVIALIALAVGLSGGEPALPVCGYLASYALFLDRTSSRARLLSLLPYMALVIGWRVLYDRLGYGALLSGIYLDPGREPLTFAAALAVRLPMLMLSQFALPMSDLWEAYPLLASWLQPAMFAFALLVLSALAWLFWPLLRADARARFWALGCVLSAVPVCGTHPEDRVLTAASLGGAALVATFLSASAQADFARPARFVATSGLGLIAIHLVIAPLLLPPRILAIDAMERLLLASDASIPRGASAARKTVVLLNPPLDLFAVYLPPFRLARGIGMPRSLRWLATGESALEIQRMDAQTLKITPDDGFLSTSSQRMFRRSERSFRRGERVVLSDVAFEVTELTRDGRPRTMVARFTAPLSDENFAFLRWDQRAYRPFVLPALGQTVHVPAVDLRALLID